MNTNYIIIRVKMGMHEMQRKKFEAQQNQSSSIRLSPGEKSTKKKLQ